MEEIDLLFKQSYGKLYRVVFYAGDIMDNVQGFFGTLIEYTGSYFLFQLEDGSINIPKVLRPYMGGKEIIIPCEK